MVANVAEGRSADKPSQAGAVRKRVPSARRPTPRRVAVVAGLLLLPLGTILLTGVPLHCLWWTAHQRPLLRPVDDACAGS